MNKLHLICAAVLDTAQVGGLPKERVETLFNGISPFLANVPEETVKLFIENVRRILDAKLSVEEAP
jgi:hypothetical protein